MFSFNEFLSENKGGRHHRDVFFSQLMTTKENLPFVVNTDRGTHKFRDLLTASLNHGSMANYARYYGKMKKHSQLATTLAQNHENFTNLIRPHISRAVKLAVARVPSPTSSYLLSKYNHDQLVDRTMRQFRNIARSHLKGSLRGLPLKDHLNTVTGYFQSNNERSPHENYARGGHFGMIDDNPDTIGGRSTAEHHTAEFFTKRND